MRLQGFLTRSQVESVHRNALRVLADVGVEVQHAELRRILESVGGTREEATCRVRFAPAMVERLIADAPKHLSDESVNSIYEHSGIYQSQYLDPESGRLGSFTEEILAFYIALARHIHGGHVVMLGVPFIPAGIPPTHLPLAEKLYAWKHGASCGSVQLTKFCGPLLELFRVHAAATGKSVEDVFSATGYLVSPLKLARPECEQVLFFRERGLRMQIGNLPMQGGTAPVSFAGALTLSLAEYLFLFLLAQALWGDARLHIGGGVATMDMRSAVSCYGRPEMQRINSAWADIARFYGCTSGGHAGLTDAKAPSVQAGVQKSTGALMTCLANGAASVEGGLLAMDEICSPVQMVLDHDTACSLRTLVAERRIDDAECAVEEIAEVGPGGSFLGTDLTAARFRGDLFQPRTWDNQSVAAWLAGDARNDIDRARSVVLDFRRDFVPQGLMTADEESELQAIVRQAME